MSLKQKQKQPTQALQQQVCQKYGWSYEYGRMPITSNINEEEVEGVGEKQQAEEEEGQSQPYKYYVEIIIPYYKGPRRRFVSDVIYRNNDDEKDAKRYVSSLALEGLSDEIDKEEIKPLVELTTVFADTLSSMTIYDSNDPQTWTKFWKDVSDCSSSGPPMIVGIDTEGNNISPPVLIQVSTDLGYTILEAPPRDNGSISTNMQKLLQDDTITKIFCDNFYHKDKKSLGMLIIDDNNNNNDNDKYTEPPIIDIEQLGMKLWGPVKVARGLSRLVSLSMPELNVRIGKPKTNNKKGAAASNKNKNWYERIGKFALIEQGKLPPLNNGIQDLTIDEQHYAALDSYCTLQSYKRIQQQLLLNDDDSRRKGEQEQAREGK